jgi:hypothetical protein
MLPVYTKNLSNFIKIVYHGWGETEFLGAVASIGSLYHLFIMTGKSKYSEKNLPQSTLSNTNPTWTDLDLCFCDEKLASDHVSFAMA